MQPDQQPAALTPSSGSAGAPNAPLVRPGTTLIVCLILILLFIITGVLVGAYRQEKRLRGAHHFQVGLELQARGELREAVEHFREALVFAESEEYTLALVEALMKAGRYAEAEAYLARMLESDPTSGIGNLLLARIRKRLDDPRIAQASFARAIFGRWGPEEEHSRTEARFELADYLLDRGDTDGALSELLSLRNEVADDPVKLEQLAALLERAGAHEYARSVYLEVTKSEPRDVTAHLGLARSEFALANATAARRAAQQALRLEQGNREALQLLETTRSVEALDPTARRLSSQERLSRTARLIERLLGRLRACVDESSRDSAVQDLELVGEAAIAQARQRGNASQKAEEALEAAGRLWRGVRERCGAELQDPVLYFLSQRLEEH